MTPQEQFEEALREYSERIREGASTIELGRRAFGSTLRFIREACKLTLKDVKKRTGLSIEFLGAVEAGNRELSPNSLAKLMKVYDNRNL